MAAARVAAAALQYSKWMSRFICYAWITFRFAALIAGIIRPEAAEAFASTLINLDWIMLVNEGTYLINSLGEKYIFSDRFILRWIDKGGFKSMIAQLGYLRNKKKEINNNYDESIDDDDTGGDDDDGGEENG